MKTVGELVGAKLELVCGDRVLSITDDCDSESVDLFIECSVPFRTGTDWVGIGKNAYAHKNWVLKEFEWRENTGVKPEFNGLIDAELSNGEVLKLFRKDYLWWNLDAISPILKWRPSLNQPSVAEPNTKESAIHKAWVGLKGDLSNARQYDENGSYLAVCIKDGFFTKEGGYGLSDNLVENTEYWKDVCTVSEFTDYCEKMAAEEKRMDIICQNGNDGLHYDNTAQQVEALASDIKQVFTQAEIKKSPSERMKAARKECDKIIKEFNKPTDKPIFTQAMADAGELPPVGSLFIDIEYNENKQVLALAHHLGKVVYAADYDDVSQVDYFHAGQDECKPIDMRTEIDKAIDAAMTDIGAEHGDRASVASVVECMIAAGYSKC